DLLVGALDAHLHPQWPRRGRWAVRWLGAGLAAVLAAVASQRAELSAGLALIQRLDPHWYGWVFPWRLTGAVVLTALWLLVGLAAWRIGARFLAGFGALLALRFAADWIVIQLAFASLYGAGLAVPVVAAIVAIPALWVTVAAVLMRRAGVGWPLAVG